MSIFFSFDRKRLSKSPIWPALMSALIIPGIGQLYNRDIGKGLFLMVVFLGSFFWFVRTVTRQLMLLINIDPSQWEKSPHIIQEALVKIVNQNPSMFGTFQILLLLVWVYSIFDAYQTAKGKISQIP